MILSMIMAGMMILRVEIKDETDNANNDNDNNEDG